MDIKKKYTRVILKAAEHKITDEIIDEYKRLWFWSYRKKDSGGLRLTDVAIEFIQEEADIKTYKIDFPKEFGITPQVLLWLDHHISTPFHITPKCITVLHEREAFELYLLSGDINKLGHNKAMNKRLSSQE